MNSFWFDKSAILTSRYKVYKHICSLLLMWKVTFFYYKEKQEGTVILQSFLFKTTMTKYRFLSVGVAFQQNSIMCTFKIAQHVPQHNHAVLCFYMDLWITNNKRKQKHITYICIYSNVASSLEPIECQRVLSVSEQGARNNHSKFVWVWDHCTIVIHGFIEIYMATISPNWIHY